MRKLLLLFILGIFCMNLLFAQEERKTKFQFNLATNISIPYEKKINENSLYQWMVYEDDNEYLYSSYNSRLGYLIEVLTDTKLSENFYLLVGLNYNANRLKYDVEYELYTWDGVLNISYVNLPLLLKYKLNKIPGFSVSAGMFFGWNVVVKDYIYFRPKEGYYNIYDAKPSDNKYIHNMRNKYYFENYGLLFQLDYEKPLNHKLTAVVFSRLNYGLRNILKPNWDQHIWKTYDIAFGFGLKI